MNTDKAHFPLNAWYIAAWSYEVGKREPLARTVCNKKMVLWRKADNSILPGINAVQKRLEVQVDGFPRLVVTPACVETINEFE